MRQLFIGPTRIPKVLQQFPMLMSMPPPSAVSAQHEHGSDGQQEQQQQREANMEDARG